ncbi:MAG TPA: hypothetical protein VF815_20815 [Myxococcaceae bacterium]|jgi:hypothetical protein
MRTLAGLLTALWMLVSVGCTSEDPDDPPDNKPDAGQITGTDEPQLGASCTVSPDSCPGDMTCYFELGCLIPTCPSAGPGGEHGCPRNGFCYAFDSSSTGYCARRCETDADCKAVNPSLTCLERAATEAFGMKICVAP